MEQFFSKEHTQLAKGIAVCLLLVHHLFFVEAAGYDELYIADIPVVNGAASVAKVCVCLFLMLSGFGLSRSSRELPVFTFYKRRLARLYPAYWMTWLIFVPIAVICLDRTFVSVYPENTWLYFSVNLLGIQVYFDTLGYIGTWWFMTAILTMYALFPVLIRIPLFPLLLFSLLLDVMSPWFVHGILRHWLFPFVMGIALERYHIFKYLMKVRCCWAAVVFFLTAAIGFAWPRLYLENIGLGLWTDTPFAVCLLCLLFLITRNKTSFSRRNVLIVSGRFSYEIFLSHTFIIAYFCKDIVYISRQPVIIFVLGLGLSLAAAWLVQRLTAKCADALSCFRVFSA